MKDISDQRKKEKKEAIRGMGKEFLKIIVYFAICYFIYHNFFQPKSAQVKESLNYVDSIESYAKSNIERPETFEAISSTDKYLIYENRYTIREIFRYKDWKDNWNVRDIAFYFDSTGHVTDIQVKRSY